MRKGGEVSVPWEESNSRKLLTRRSPAKPDTVCWPGRAPVAGPLPNAVARGGPVLVAGRLEVLEDLPRGGRVWLDVVGLEAGAVEVAEEVLHARAAGDPAGIEADDHDPLLVAPVAVDRQLEQVGALPGAADRVGRPEVAQVPPALEVLGPVDRDLALNGLDDDHPPLSVGLVPEHLRIAELAVGVVEHRVAGVLRPGPPAIGAVGQRLLLVIRVCARVDRHHRRVAARAEAARVPVVDHRAA